MAFSLFSDLVGLSKQTSGSLVFVAWELNYVFMQIFAFALLRNDGG